MKLEILVFGSENFNNTIQEIKENFDYSLIFFDFENPQFHISSNIVGVIVDNQIYKNNDNFNMVNKFNKKPIIFLTNDLNTINHNNFNNKILLPIFLLEFKNKIKNIIATSKFILNSAVKIKEYILNKNEKKLIKFDISISLTEREVQLVELLFKEKKSLSKKFILKKIWNYSTSADTHTVETHIYRLRKKISNKFKDNNFILNNGNGYSLWKREIKLHWIYFQKNTEKELLKQKREKVVLKEKKRSN